MTAVRASETCRCVEGEGRLGWMWRGADEEVWDWDVVVMGVTVGWVVVLDGGERGRGEVWRDVVDMLAMGGDYCNRGGAYNYEFGDV